MFEFTFEISLLLLLCFLTQKRKRDRKRDLVNKRDKAGWWGVGGSKKEILA